LGGLLIHGVTPGPALFTENKSLVYLIYITFFVATVVVMLLQAYGVKFFIKLLKIPPQYLMVGIMIMCVIGTYAIRNSFFDVYTMIIIGLFGYLLLLAKIPVTPVVLGLVLGPTLEKEFRTAMILSENDYSVFFTSPLAVTLYILIVVFVGMQLYADRKLKKAALEDAKSLPTVAS
jgi:putative tricarboxylic transport membrane protein